MLIRTCWIKAINNSCCWQLHIQIRELNSKMSQAINCSIVMFIKSLSSNTTESVESKVHLNTQYVTSKWFFPGNGLHCQWQVLKQTDGIITADEFTLHHIRRKLQNRQCLSSFLWNLNTLIIIIIIIIKIIYAQYTTVQIHSGITDQLGVLWQIWAWGPHPCGRRGLMRPRRHCKLGTI